MIFRVLDPIQPHRSSRREPITESTAVYKPSKGSLLLGLVAAIVLCAPLVRPPRIPEPTTVVMSKSYHQED